MGMKSFGLKHALLMGAAAFGLGAATVATSPAYAQEATRSYNIPAQDLDDALREFGRQTGRDVLFTPRSVAGKRSVALAGQMSERQALEALLAGSGLRFEQTASGAYAVQDPTSPTQLGDVRNSPPSDEEIVVTGTRLRGAAPAGSPIIVHDRREIENSGASTLEQFLTVTPENFASVNSSSVSVGVGGESRGDNVYQGAGVNLRGLGAGSTLTLLNGRRLAPAGIQGGFSDISIVPLAAIERIEVLTDGASAIYGGDAVGGVANVILRRDFSGAETTLRYSDTTNGGGSETLASQAFGADWTNGNLIAGYEYYEREGLQGDERSFSSTDPVWSPPSLITPQQRHNFFFSGRQAIESIELSVDGYFSRRTFEGSTGATGFPETSSGEAEQYGANFAATRELGADWQGAAQLSLAESRSEIDLSQPPFSAHLENASSLYELSLNFDGPLPLMGGRARGAFGAALRRERFQDRATSPNFDEDRDVSSVFGEVFLPLGPFDQEGALTRFDISVAGRYDDYSDFGSNLSPKIGVSAELFSVLTLRASYTQSFRPPQLAQVNTRVGYLLFPLPDSAALDGVTNTLLNVSPGNPDLGAEQAETMTIGIDYRPDLLPGLSLSATAFAIQYDDRIAYAPILGTIFDIFAQRDVLSIYLNESPTLAEINNAYACGCVNDPFGIGAGGVEALFDNRLQNLASDRSSGLDITASYSWESGVGQWEASLSATRLFELERQTLEGAPTVDFLDTVYNPVDLRIRADLGYTRGAFSIGGAVNYADSYTNNLVTPNQEIDSWTTIDLRGSYRAGDEQSGLQLDLIVQNIFDEPPPFVASPPDTYVSGFDPTNASPLGRVIALQLRKAW